MSPRSQLTEEEHREKLTLIQNRAAGRFLGGMLPPPKRYDQLIDLVAEQQPETILEVGTWSGLRALEMLAVCPDAHYYGFDLFEDATPETNEREKNVKRAYSLESVANYLSDYETTLVKGDTRVTLREFVKTHPDLAINLAFIDGGHSVATIALDWYNVSQIMAPDGVVVFDDYYIGPEIDIERFGCNRTVATLPHQVWPLMDGVVPDGGVKMVLVRMADLEP